MMLWRVGEGRLWLLRTAERAGAVFLLVDTTGNDSGGGDVIGAVVRRFADGSSSDEDDLWQWHHHVVNGALHKRTTMERYGSARSGPDKEEDEVVLDGLSDPVDDPAALALVVRAIAAHDARAQRAADARVAATGAPLDARHLDPQLARAHAALVWRVRAYDDALASALLRTLVDVAGSPMADARVKQSVHAAYARACLLACFEHDVPSLIALAQPARDVLAAPLVASLVERARDLDDAADSQERADAMNNARAYHGAAAALRTIVG